MDKDIKEDFSEWTVHGNNSLPIYGYSQKECDEISDWWLQKFSDLQQKVKNLKELGTYAVYSDERYHQDAYNQALEDVLALFKNSPK